MELDEALKLALDGRAILFLGAGFSRGATNISGDDFALGGQLARRLAEASGAPLDLQIDDAAELYAEKFGDQSLVEELKSAFSSKETTEAQRAIATVPWRRVYTTNYDDVFELACTTSGKRVDSISPLDDSQQISKRAFLCVHLNGSIRKVTTDSVWSDLKLTQTSYDNGSSLEGPWGSLFRADVEAAQAVFFVGYSLYDLDIRRLLFEEQLKDKSFFVLGLTPGMATAHRAAKYGLLIASGTDEFAAEIAEAKTKHVPEDNPSPINYSLRPYSFGVTAVSLEDRNIFDLLLFGKLRSDFIGSTYLGQMNYFCTRDVVEQVFSRMQAGTRVITVHSSLGNGKTLTLEALKYRTHSAGRKVFTLVNRGESLLEEIQVAIVGFENPIFFIDNYIEWLDILPAFGAHASEDFTLVLSARSASHDLLLDRVGSDLRTDDIFDVDIDVLSDVDLQVVSAYLDEFGLWGDQANLSKYSKISELKRNCEAEWHSILLKLLDSPQIVDRLQTLFNILRTVGVYRDPIVRLLVLAVLAFQPQTSLLIELCGDKILEAGFRKDGVAKELVEFGRSSIGVRSSVVASALLKQIVDPNSTIQAVISLLRRTDTLTHSAYNNELFRSLIRFSNLSLLLPERDRGRAGMRIYEGVKHLDRCARSPLFWLQYAIASLVAQNFDRAKTYFDNAYSFAGALYAYDSHQIDNHYARFLVERAIHQSDPALAMSAFREARVLIYAQLRDERRHYPYRVAAGWFAFYDFFEDRLQDSEKSEIWNAAEYVIEKIEALPDDRRTHPAVSECRKAMHLILQDRTPAEYEA